MTKKEKIKKLIKKFDNCKGDPTEILVDILYEVEDMTPEEVDEIYREIRDR